MSKLSSTLRREATSPENQSALSYVSHAPTFDLTCDHDICAGTCDELQEAAAATCDGDVIAELTSGEVTCESWTTFEIANNKLKIVLDEASRNVDGGLFYNVRFLVSSGALHVDVPVRFRGDKAGHEVLLLLYTQALLKK